MASKNIPPNGWPQLKDLEAVQPTLNRLDKIEAWKRTVKEETFTGEELTIPNALKLPARSLKTTIEATQDLHGLPFPYAGGAYKNKLPMTVEGIKAANTDGTWSGNVYTINGGTITILTDSANNVTGFKANGTFNANIRFIITSNSGIGSGSYVLNGCPSGGSDSTYRIYAGYHQTEGGQSYGSADTGSGRTYYNIYSIVNVGIDIMANNTLSDVVFYPMIRLSTESDASFAPYSNICPISGRTEVVVADEGKNLLPMSITALKERNTAGTWSGNTYTKGGIIFDCEVDTNGYIKQITINGTSSDNYTWLDLTGLRFDGQFKVTGGYSSNVYIRIGEGTDASDSGSGIASDTGAGATINCVSDKYYAYSIGVRNGSYTNVVIKPMVWKSDITDDAFVPYTPTVEVIVQLGTTVYRADINWDTGVMTVKTATKTYTGETDEGWDGDVPTRQYWSNATINNKVKGYIVCNEFKGVQVTTWADLQDNQIAFHPTVQNNLRVKYSGAADITAFRTFLASNPMQVEYELATPTTLQLTPTQLQMLKGYNRITLADGYGTIELKALTGANWS